MVLGTEAVARLVDCVGKDGVLRRWHSVRVRVGGWCGLAMRRCEDGLGVERRRGRRREVDREAMVLVRVRILLIE